VDPEQQQQPPAQQPSELEQERQRLYAEIQRLNALSQQKDPDGTASEAALQANKRLEKLNDDYRQILIALKPAASATGTINDVTRGDGSVWRIDAQGKPTQVLGPGGKALGSNNITTNTTDQYVVSVDQTDGHLITVKNPNYVAPKPGQVSANTSDPFIVQQNPDGTLNPVKNPNYQPKPTQVSANSTDQFIVQTMPDGTIQTNKNPNYQPKTPTVVGGTTGTDQQFIIKQNPDGSTTQVPNPNYVPKSPTGVSTSTDQPFIVRQKPDGTIENVPNPNYQPRPSTVTTSSESPFIVQQKPDGTMSQVPNPNYVPPKPTQVTTGVDQPFVTTMGPDGKLVSQPNPSYQPKTLAQVQARIAQINQLAAAKSVEVQGKVGQGNYTADNALADFNGWYDKNVAPELGALKAAQDDAAFQRQKDEMAARTSAYTAASGAGRNYIDAFNAEKTNRVGAGFADAAAQIRPGGKPLSSADIAAAVSYRAPNPTDIAPQAVDQALKYIDPRAAAAAGAPPPTVQNTDPAYWLDRTRYMPQGPPPGAPPGGPPPPVFGNAPPPQAMPTDDWFAEWQKRQAADAALQQQQAQIQMPPPPPAPVPPPGGYTPPGGSSYSYPVAPWNFAPDYAYAG